MVQSQIIPRITAQKRRKPSIEWKRRRKQNWSVIQAGRHQAKHISPSKSNITTSYPRVMHTIPLHKHYPQHHLSTPSNRHPPSAITHTQQTGNLRSQTLKEYSRNLRTPTPKKASRHHLQGLRPRRKIRTLIRASLVRYQLLA